MSTVTNTDFVLDATGLGDANPYTNATLTAIGSSTMRVASGVLRNLSGNSSGVDWRIRKNGTATRSTIRASVEVSGTNSYNQRGPCIITSAGAGYALLCSYNALVFLLAIDAAGAITDIADIELGVDAGTVLASGGQMHLECDPATGDIRGYENTTLILSANDTTYSTGLMPGIANRFADADMSTGFLSIGGDYLTGGGGGDPLWAQSVF